MLSVTGKRNKTRDVPLANDVVDLLRDHAADFARAEAEAGADQNESTCPLIFALQGSVPQWGLVAGVVRQVTVVEEGGGPLSAAGIYAILTRFFWARRRGSSYSGPGHSTIQRGVDSLDAP